MVRITERATSALHDFLVGNEARPESGVRLTPAGNGRLGMVVDEPHAGDEVIHDRQTPVLIVDGAVAGQLTDMIVDFKSVEDDPQSGGFVIKPVED